METITRRCRECGHDFDIEPEEQEFFRRLSDARQDTDWHLPSRCTDCRARRRRQRRPLVVDDGSTEYVVCVDCREEFTFGGRDRSYFASRGWCAPTRCRPCRQARPVREAG
jgi:hypothetical protein